MRYRSLGDTGLLVSELCLGAMTFGGEAGMWRDNGALDQAASTAQVRRAFDAGVNIFDTADAYSAGESERVLGQALRALGVPRNEYLIATKAFAPTGMGPNTRGASRLHILHSVEASLERLGCGHIDLYQMHGFDPLTPIEETVRALETLVQRGLVRYVGVSNWAAWQIMKALGLQDRLGFARLASLQAHYAIATRDLERELRPMLLAEQVGLLVWGPLSSGYLSGKYSEGAAAVGGRRDQFDFPPVDRTRADRIIAAMRPIAAAHDASVARIAIAWLLHQPVVTSVIIGARREEQLIDSLAAADITLSAEELAALDASGALAAEYPQWLSDFMAPYRLADPAAAARLS